MLDREVDVLWVTPKATQLEASLELAPPESVGEALVVPLLNGVDHVAFLRERYEHVLAAAISVESERVEPGFVRQRSAFAQIVIAPDPRRDTLVTELRAAGFDVALASDEATLLWEKLSFLAPFALTTTALGAPVGVVQADPAGICGLSGATTRRSRSHSPGTWRSTRRNSDASFSSSPAVGGARRCRRTSKRVGLSSSTRSRGRSCAGGGDTGSRRRRRRNSFGSSRRG